MGKYRRCLSTRAAVGTWVFLATAETTGQIITDEVHAAGSATKPADAAGTVAGADGKPAIVPAVEASNLAKGATNEVESPTIMTLNDALAQALKSQPSLRQAKAQVEAAEGRVEQARAGYLPQVTATASYQRTTGNYVMRPGATAGTIVAPSATNKLYNYFNFATTATQLIYDFGQTNGRWTAAASTVESQKATENSVRNQTVSSVYSAFFQAAANQALLRVAKDNLDNQRRHFEQIDATVTVGIRPEIDRTQALADFALARVSFINSRNSYETAKSQLNQIIGAGSSTEYELSEEELGPVDGEGQTVEQLVMIAVKRRPEVTALERQKASQLATLRALRGGYGPSLSAMATISDAGIKLNDLRYNWNVGVTLTWPILQGGLTHGQIREATANIEATDAQLRTARLQIETQVVQAKLAIEATTESLPAVDEAVVNARERLKLAEGRYTNGVGNVIELSDAQVAYTDAQAQAVVARFSRAAARAQLLTALGLR